MRVGIITATPMHSRFGLTLIVNHACNLRCTYCYTGEKFRRPMELQIGQKAIDRAISSIGQHGALDLAFFGGEPLIESELILSLIKYARGQAADRDIELALSMTTNGTFDSPAALSVMMLPDMRLAISHDGLPSVHDGQRLTIEGQPSSQRVLNTIARLTDAGKDFRVVLVVQPSTVQFLPDGIEFLYRQNVSHFDPSLNFWTTWTRADGDRLKEAIRRAADFWADHLPDCSVSWFDEKAARLSGVPITETARCGFGHGEIAVTPAGNMYPCERLVGTDEEANPMRLPGHVFDADDFLCFQPHSRETATECAPCSLRSLCNTTTCRCSNFIRTGDTNRPDGLLCLLDQTCYEETRRVLESRVVALA